MTMTTKKFNIDDWYPQSADTATPSNPQTQSSVADDIERIVKRIEATHIDITSGYDNWLSLGFALSDALGESGRDYFHRISRFNPDYNYAECDRQYDKCLKSHGSGITVKTLFQKAKESGIDISTRKSAKYATSAISALNRNADTCSKFTHSTVADIADTADIAETETPLPTFSDKIAGHLPELLAKIAAVSNSPQDADILLLGSLTVLSACLPHISGIYDKRTVYPNLFLFVTAKASSGKGRLTLCRHLVQPIHDRLRDINEAEMIEYKQRLAEYSSAGKKKAAMEKPEEPPMKMLFIPANSSATAVYQVLNDNNGEGLMFETEGDTLANTFGSDYGNYSDGFRKAFHHETISYIRRKDREYVSIRNPRLSTLLTGTPHQILNLIPDAENGLFSRFAFYALDTCIVWNNVFDNSIDGTLDDYFRALGEDYQDFYNILRSSKDLLFSLTPKQQEHFNTTFDRYQTEYIDRCGEDFIASVRRLGVITFRIAMILSALRIMETGNFENDIVCLDRDYDTAISIAEVLIEHNAKVFLDLPQSQTKPGTAAKGSARNRMHHEFFTALPDSFDRKEYLATAIQVGINQNSVDRLIRKWCGEGKLENISHGKYRKTQC